MKNNCQVLIAIDRSCGYTDLRDNALGQLYLEKSIYPKSPYHELTKRSVISLLFAISIINYGFMVNSLLVLGISLSIFILVIIAFLELDINEKRRQKG